MKFSLIGTNANGLSGKLDSLNSAITFFNRPSCITVQETKLRSKNLKIPGYQVFLKNRKGFGGGLLTAVEENLAPVLISSSESEILVVQTKVGPLNIRIINGYGPQETESKQSILDFWQEVEKQIINARDENCCVIIQMDANAKLGNNLIPGDPNVISDNGKILIDIITRQNLYVLNSDNQCTGVITRHRITKHAEEKSVLDFMIVCPILKTYFEQMMIDEERIHVLTKYSSRKGVQTNIKSDHNVMHSRFSISYNQVKRKVIRELFNFKNREGQKKFYEITNNSKKLSACFNDKNKSFSKQAGDFWKNLKGTFHQSFKKVRVTNKTARNLPCDDIQEALGLKTKLQKFLKSAKSPFSHKFIKAKIEILEKKISQLTAKRNADTVSNQIKSLETTEGSFSQTGM